MDKIAFCKYIMIYDTYNKKIKFLENPIYKKAIKSGYKECGEHGFGTGEVLPLLLKEENVEVFLAKKIGEGLLGNLEAFNIKTIFSNKKIEDILNEY